MTISKPLGSTILSFTLFLLISYILIGMCFIQVLKDQQPSWYIYLTLSILTPLALYLTNRIFINYKILEIGKDTIVVKYTVRKKVRSYNLDKVISWTETVVKTGKNSAFKEIEIKFEDGFTFSLGLKEYSNYPKVYAYLSKKLAKKKLISP